MQILLDQSALQIHYAFSTTQRIKSALSRATEIMINHESDRCLKIVSIMLSRT